MTDRSRFSIIPIGSLHAGWALKIDGVIRRTSPSLIPLGAYVDAIMAGASEADADNIARATEARPWPSYEERIGVFAPAGPWKPLRDPFKKQLTSCGASTGCSRQAEFADGWHGSDTAMRSMPVVVVKPERGARRCAVARCRRPGIGPFAQSGLDEALGLAVGPRRVGLGADVLRPRRCRRCGSHRLGSRSRCRS